MPPPLLRPVSLLVLLCLISLTACRGAGRSTDLALPDELPTSDPWPEDGEAWAEATLAEMTLEEKVSQLFSSYAYAYFKSADSPAYQRLVDLVERFGVGGVIFFQGEPMEQAVLANDLQARARWPLLVSQDMEWGAGMRIERATSLPRTMAFGATRDAELAYAAGYLTAQEARAVGVHQIFAPVADVNNNPRNPIINVRSYGERPALVAEMVGAFVRGAQAGGAIATAKHFPGHGDTATDSHLGLPVLPHSRARLDALELVPFQAAIEAGVMSIMTGHLAFPEVEPNAALPASLSRRVTTGLLREEMGFGGLVVTDALNMSGVAKLYGTGEAAVRALEAGADMLLFSNDEYAARAAILRALQAGRLVEERIDASVRRVLQAKAWAGLDRKRQVELEDVRRHVSTPLHEAFAETAARASLTLLRNENDLLPLLEGDQRILSVTLSDGESPSTGDTFNGHLRRVAPPSSRITTRLLDRRSHDTDYQQVLREATRYDVVLVPTYVRVRSWSGRIRLSAEHQRFLNGLVAQGTPVVVISFGNPYLALGLEQPAAYVAAYGAADVSQEAAAEALVGQSPFAGRLPVSIPGLYAYGAGLQLPQAMPRRGYPEAVGMTTPALFPVDSLLRAAVADSAFPGAAVAIGRGDVIVKQGGYGYFTYDAFQPVTPQSRFDLASLTKVVATTTAAMLLYEGGRLDLDAPVARYLPAFGQNGKEKITIRQLLTHTAGLIPFRPFYKMAGMTSREAVLEAILAEKPVYEPGTESRYSDLGFITLALVVEAITGRPFAEYTQEAIFEPLGMTRTGFRRTDPARRGQAVGGDSTVVPTEVDETFRKRLVQGEVHDETAFLLGGTAGHAGLFSTAEDLARFAAMLTGGGRGGGRPFLKPETIALFTTPVDPTRRRHTRALGWDTKSPEGYSSAGQHFGPGSFGHTGFTGTSLWIDPDQRLFAILLTNRVYPTRENRRHVAVRPQLADLAYRAIVGPPQPLLPGPADEAMDEGRGSRDE